MNSILSFSLFVVFFLIIQAKACAKDFGIAGNTFTIKEESILEMIQRKLSEIDLQKEQEKFAEKAKKSAAEPRPVFGITKAKRTRHFTFDPTEIVKKDIKYPNGEIMHKAGIRVNPLDHMDFDRKLYFIDASDETQVQWIKKVLKKESEEQKIVILVKGKIFDLEEELNQKVYFDQAGFITKKMKIKAVPAFAYHQKGEKFLRISEYKI